MKLVLKEGSTQRVVEVSESSPFVVTLDGQARSVDMLEFDQAGLSLIADGRSYACEIERKGEKVRVYVEGSRFEFEVIDERKARRSAAAGALGEGGPQIVLAPMPGKVARVLVRVGQAVKAGEGLLVIEAMKMENELRAVRDGTVKEIAVQEGVSVEGGAKLCVVA